jgi:hypothetical protein
MTAADSSDKRSVDIMNIQLNPGGAGPSSQEDSLRGPCAAPRPLSVPQPSRGTAPRRASAARRSSTSDLAASPLFRMQDSFLATRADRRPLTANCVAAC